jgi:hypothetical protein
MPLRKLFTRDFVVENRQWDNECCEIFSTIRHPMAIPDKLLALAMPSVVTTFDRNPPPPRLLATDSVYIEDLISRYTLASVTAYEGITNTVKTLAALLRHRINVDHTEPSVSGKCTV